MAAASRRISESTVRRLSLYLRTLEALQEDGEATVASHVLAQRAGTTAAQVRKDLSSFGSFGKRGLGYAVEPLTLGISRILGLDRRWPVLLVGAGRMGAALFDYPPFRVRGFEIVAVLDRDPGKIGRRWNGLRIEAVEELRRVIGEQTVRMGILAVPSAAAQGLADEMVEAGVRGILNLAPIRLRVPAGVVVNNVDLVLEMEAISFALRSRVHLASSAADSGPAGDPGSASTADPDGSGTT